MQFKSILFLLFLSNIVLIKSAYSQEENWDMINLESDEKFMPSCMTHDTNNNIYASTGHNFYKIINGEANDLTRPLPEGMNSFNINRLILSHENVVWGASETGIFQYFIEKDSMVITNKKEMTGGGFDYTFFTNMVFDENKNLWFTSRNPYLSIYTGNEFIDHDLYWQNDIINTSDRSPLEFDSNNHSIWLGGTDGILKVNTEGNLNNFDYHKYSFEDCLISGKITSFMFDDLDRIWITSTNGEISYFENNEWTSFEIPDSLIDKWVNPNNNKPNFIKYFGKDQYGNLYLFWVHSNYILKLTPVLKLEKILMPKKYIKEFGVDILAKPHTDMKGNLWISTTRGLLKYTPKPTSVKDYKTKSIIPDIYIRKLYPNPASTKMTAELMIFPEEIHKVKIEVFNYLGMKVKDLTDLVNVNLSTADAALEFNVDDLDNGIYYFTMSKGREKRVKPFVKVE